jgi:hypothetical protein
MAAKLPFALEAPQREAWRCEIKILAALDGFPENSHVFFEFVIPRMGRRADVVLIAGDLVLVLEFKVGSTSFDRHAIDQTYGYALDLKHFHETSHHAKIVPVLIATEATTPELTIRWADDGISSAILVGSAELQATLRRIIPDSRTGSLDGTTWSNGRYKPTPTIIEAAQALYAGHDVQEISRSEAGAQNLTRTAACIDTIIDNARASSKKVICFVTGVPGSGKTLAGLNIANRRMHGDDDEHAVFLSGNGPLVDVLREALVQDALVQAKLRGAKISRVEEIRRASSFIQNIHHFRDEALHSDDALAGKVVIFDEAQRAWNVDQTSKFMRDKRGQTSFSMSEPAYLLSVMDRHPDWCAVVCLIGGGQEINTGEAGIGEWLTSVQRAHPDWEVHMSPRVDQQDLMPDQVHTHDALHLATSIRSFRAERLSDFVAAVIEGDAPQAREVLSHLIDYPIVLTRSLPSARDWLRKMRRGNERAGLLASSNGLRLKPHGIFVKAKVEPARWFLSSASDVRSSDALEDAATEFEVQGLELDWACVAWDANYRRSGASWDTLMFRGSEWNRVGDPDRRRYIANAYRVLLTRARQGLVIYVPLGDDEDRTRPPATYTQIADFLQSCGIPTLEAA